MKMKKCIALLAGVIILLHVSAQSYDTMQTHPIVLLNATIHVGNGKVYENGIIGFEKGVILFVGDAQSVKFNAENFEVIHAAGKHIYPGLIAPNTTLGLNELEAVRATNDIQEAGTFNPNVRSIVAYNTDSRVIPTLRSNGILLAQIVPQGNIISGTSSIVETDGWNWEDAAYLLDEGLHLHWPDFATFKWNNGLQLVENPDYIQKVHEIETYFNQAIAYGKTESPTPLNLRFEAMRGVFNGEKQLFIHANGAKEIMHAVHFAKSLEIPPVIVGGSEAHLVLEILKENDVPVILERVHALPYRNDYDVDMAYKLPYILHRAGILCGLSVSNGSDGYWNQRNLPFEAGTAAAYGLTREEALQCITLNNAKILGIDATTGSLEQGKDATLLICEGDLLDMRSSNITAAYIRGRAVDIKNWQDALFGKYVKKYGGN